MTCLGIAFEKQTNENVGDQPRKLNTNRSSTIEPITNLPTPCRVYKNSVWSDLSKYAPLRVTRPRTKRDTLSAPGSAASTNWPTVFENLSVASVFAGMRRSYTNEFRTPRGRRWAETGNEDAVYESDNDGEDDEDEEGVDKFQAGRCDVKVCSPERL
jgi:hypothetical protein